MKTPPLGWSITTIGELSDVARGSSPRPIADERYFVGGDIPWIKIADATKSGKYLYETREKVNQYGASFSRLLPAGSLIVAASGTLGYTQILGVPGCVHDGWLYITNLRGVDRDYLYYFFQWKKQHFYNSAYGAAIQNINTEILRQTEIFLPPLPLQKKIGATLSAYDDLIENNARRIATLERVAQTLYREWFVNFRFPGYENAKMFESEMGLIPETWIVKPLKDLAALITRGISPAYDEAAEGRVINQKCIRDGRLSLIHVRRQSKKVPREKFVQVGDVLVNSTGVGTLGRVAQVHEPIADCTVDSHVTIVRPKETPEFFGRTLVEAEAHFIAQGVGSTGQTELSRERIGATPIVVPPNALRTMFCRVVSPMNRMVLCCMKKNEILRATRDLLLPKLVSGEVSVEQIEKEAVAQTV
jgi:type I restriction enzyme S subunit